MKFGEGFEEAPQLRKKRETKDMKVQSKVTAARVTISFPAELYETLEEIAKNKKVSLAWVVREAAEQYVTDKWPLFRER